MSESPPGSAQRGNTETERVVSWTLLLAAAAASLAMAACAARRSHFFSDDMASLFLLRRDGLAAFVQRPVNVQWVPLHRIATWAQDALLGHHFAPAVASLLGLHLVTLFWLRRATARLIAQRAPRTPNVSGPQGAANELVPAIVVLLYAGYVFLGVQFMWFSSGLHRLPYALASVLALERWLAFRTAGRVGDLAWVAGAMLVATGFYAKGPLIAPHIGAVELCLWTRARTLPPWHVRAALGGLIAAGVGLSLTSALLSDQPALAFPGIGRWLSILWEGTRVLLRSVVGQTAAPNQPPGQDPALWLGTLVVAGVAMATILRRRDNLWVWAVMGACVGAHVGLLGVSNRAAWGDMIAHSHRYYLDMWVVLLPLLGVALQDLFATASPGQKPWIGALLALSLPLSLAALGLGGFFGLVDSRYARYRQTRVFVDRFEAELARIRRALPPEQRTFQDELLPPPLAGLSPEYHSLRHWALARGERMSFSRDGKLLIEKDGSIVVKGPDYDPTRRKKALREARQRMRRVIEAAGGRPPGG